MNIRRHIALPLLLASTLTLTGCDYTIVSTSDLQKTQQEVPELKDKSTKASLDDQAKCAKQAGEYVNKLSSVDDHYHYVVQNHFNSRLGKCFVLWRDIQEDEMHVDDAFE